MTSQLAQIEPAASVAIPDTGPVSSSASLMQTIARVLENPAIDIEKMERLLQMQERIMEKQAKMAYAVDMAAMQPHLPIIAERGGIKDRAGNIQSTYARWEDLNEAIKPVLSEHGFSITFRIGHDADKIVVTGVLLHREGHSEETTMRLPVDISGSKNAVQAVGSSTSYGKRYTAMALLNITSRAKSEADDDGTGAGEPDCITSEQIVELRTRLTNAGRDEQKFLKHMKIGALAAMRASEFTRAIAAIDAAVAAVNAKNAGGTL